MICLPDYDQCVYITMFSYICLLQEDFVYPKTRQLDLHLHGITNLAPKFGARDTIGKLFPLLSTTTSDATFFALAFLLVKFVAENAIPSSCCHCFIFWEHLQSVMHLYNNILYIIKKKMQLQITVDVASFMYDCFRRKNPFRQRAENYMAFMLKKT